MHANTDNNAADSRYRGILFDLDGTLLDTAEGVFSSVRHTVEALGYEPLSQEVLRTFIGPPVKKSLIRVFGLSEEDADRATEIFRDRYKNEDLLKAAPYPGILALLEALGAAGFKVGVATLKREDYAITLLDHYGISQYCNSICGSDFASKMTKADVIRKCLDSLGLAPREAVLAGDTDSDGNGAREAGVDFIAVTYGFGPADREAWSPFDPVFTADSPADIGAWLGL